MYAQNANFCLNTLSIIIGSSIEYYSICSKKRIIKQNNLNVDAETYVDEILFVCPDSLVFIGNKIRNGLKRKILFDNIRRVDLNSQNANKVTIQLNSPIKKQNKTFYEFLVQSRDIFLECFSGKYKIYQLKKTNSLKQLPILVEYEINSVFSGLLGKNKTAKEEMESNPVDIQFVSKYLNNYKFDLYFEFESDPNDPFVFHRKKKMLFVLDDNNNNDNNDLDSDNKNNTQSEIGNEDNIEKEIDSVIKKIPEREAVIKIIIPKELPIELLNSNSNELHLKFYAELSFKKYLDTSFGGEHNDHWIISQSKIQKKKIKEDLSKWKAWRFEIRTKPNNKIGLNIIYYYIRRLFIPPFFESYNDFTIIIEEQYYDDHNTINFSNEIITTIETVIDTFSPIKFQQRNGISDEIILSKMEAYLIDSRTLNYLYKDIGITGKESYKFILDYKMKLALLYEEYEKSSFAKNYMNIIKNAYEKLNDEDLDEENYKKNLKQVSFDALLASQVKLIKNTFEIVDPLTSILWESKIRNFIGFIVDKKNSPELLEKILDLNKRVPDFSKEINPVLNQFLNLEVITFKKQIVLNVSINYIISHLSEIEEISYNEKYMKIFIVNGKLQEIQKVESSLIFFEFLNVIINRNFSFLLLTAIHDYFSKIKRNSISQNGEDDELSSEALALKKYASIFITSFKKLYFDYRKSPNILVLCCKCLNILISLDKQNIGIIISEDCCITLYRYFSSSHQALLYESIKLFTSITESKCDLRAVLESNPKFVYKLINIVKGTNIPNCFYHPEIICLILNFFEEMLSFNLIKEILYQPKARKFVKYIISYITIPEVFLNHHIDYYFEITTKVYKVLAVIVLKNSEMRKYIEGNYHLIKLINTKSEEYLMYFKMINEIPKAKKIDIIEMLKAIMAFMSAYLGKDRSMMNLMKFYGKNILLLVQALDDDPNEYFNVKEFLHLFDNSDNND